MPKNAKLLIAEDNPELHAIYSKKLKERFIVDSVHSVQEAKEKFKSNVYDLVILDWEFEGERETGIDLAQYIRRINKKTKLILFSNRHSSELAEIKSQGIVDEYLEKLGTGLEELVERVEEVLGSRSNRHS